MNHCEHLTDSGDPAATMWHPVASAGSYAMMSGLIAATLIAAGFAIFLITTTERGRGFPPKPTQPLAVLLPTLGAGLAATFMFATMSGHPYCEPAALLGLAALWPFGLAVLGLVVVFSIIGADRFRARPVPSVFFAVCILTSVAMAAAGLALMADYGIELELSSVQFMALTVALGAVGGIVGAGFAWYGVVPKRGIRMMLVASTVLSLLAFGLVLATSADGIVDLADSELFTPLLWGPMVLAPLQCLLTGALLPERPIYQYGDLI